MDVKTILTELEITKIEQFNKDPEMVEAVRKVLLASIYSHGTVQLGHKPNPLINGAFSLVALALENPIPDDILGQNLRGQWAGVNALKNAFDSLASITSKKEEVETPYNEAV